MSLDREEGFVQLRSLEQALANLEADQKRRPNNADLARMIAHAKAEIADRCVKKRAA
jgi:hypothetical protein